MPSSEVSKLSFLTAWTQDGEMQLIELRLQGAPATMRGEDRSLNRTLSSPRREDRRYLTRRADPAGQEEAVRRSSRPAKAARPSGADPAGARGCGAG